MGIYKYRVLQDILIKKKQSNPKYEIFFLLLSQHWGLGIKIKNGKRSQHSVNSGIPRAEGLVEGLPHIFGIKNVS